MDKASASGAEDSRFESWAGHFPPSNINAAFNYAQVKIEIKYDIDSVTIRRHSTEHEMWQLIQWCLDLEPNIM